MNKDENSPKVKKVKSKRNAKKISYNAGGKGSNKNLVLLSGAAVLVIVISAVIFMSLTSLFKTETYYLLNTNVKAKQQITPEMVVEQETAEGTAPANALSMEEIQRGGVYSKYPLFPGDVVAKSNAGPLSGTPLGIPDDWSVTSFTINSTDAVGGTLGKGDYVDLLGVDKKGAKYIFNNVLILEVKFLNEEYDGTLDGQTIVGETMHYTIGLPSEDVARLHDALDKYEKVKMVKAPTEVNYKDRDVSKLKKQFSKDENYETDVIEGTDPTFAEVERDADGKPVNSQEETTSSDNSNEEKLNEDSPADAE